MKLSRKQVEHIANLARLSLSAKEITQFQEQLSSILDYFEQLQDLDTNDILPTTRVLSIPCRLRTDYPTASLPLDDLLMNAPDTENDQFRVPQILP
ncbi:MAG TPA: Asp-tRNA(Asn)/Glu-tRNA(Gln) amidotransferase subunit GatC [Anaerolineae bacterium]|nr:Asp-tRNA(Asn)/Glu-tRNA(Gln) amidotransferase subunit GatC [Anaerolineae bacterium]